MRIKLNPVNCKYGAPMGRGNDRISGKCFLQRVNFVDGDYDNGGAYWGGGRGTLPLWVAQDSEGGQFFVRAKSRNEAKNLIQDDMLADDVTFYR
jgi:hypothetical protein